MKKNLLILMLALTLALSLTACGGTDEPAAGTDDTTQETTQPDTAPEEGGAAGETDTPSADDGTEDETNVPSGEDGAEDSGAQEDAAQNSPAGGSGSSSSHPGSGSQTGSSGSSSQTGGTTPAQKPAEPPAQTAPPSQESSADDTVSQPAQPPAEESADSVDLTAFYDSLASTQTDWPGMMAMEGESLDTFYPGLSDISTKQCLVNMAMISASGVEIALVEVSDSADVQAVKDIFQARIDYQVGDGETPGGAWYPEPTEMWKSSSRIVSNGSYVMLVAFNGADSVVDAFNALFA